MATDSSKFLFAMCRFSPVCHWVLHNCKYPGCPLPMFRDCQLTGASWCKDNIPRLACKHQDHSRMSGTNDRIIPSLECCHQGISVILSNHFSHSDFLLLLKQGVNNLKWWLFWKCTCNHDSVVCFENVGCTTGKLKENQQSDKLDKS